MEHRTPLRGEIRHCRGLVDRGEFETAASALREAVEKDHQAAILWLKREKVFFAPRSADDFARLQDSVMAASAGLDPGVRVTIRQLLGEHRWILTPLWHLQGELDTLALWKLPRRHAVLLLFVALEAIVAESGPDSDPATARHGTAGAMGEEAAQVWTRQHLQYGAMRSLLDAGVNAFREIVRRCPPTHTDYREPHEPTWIADLLRLALQRELLQGAIDRYAYFDWTAQMTTHESAHLALEPSDQREEDALARSSQRSLLGDQQRFVELGIYEIRASMTSRKADLESHLCPGQRIRHGNLLRALPDPWEGELAEFSKRATLDTEVPQAFAAQIEDPRQPTAKAAFERLVAAWEYLIRLSWLHRLATEIARDKGWAFASEDKVILLHWSELLGAFAGYSRRPRRDAEQALLELAIPLAAAPTSADPFITPLIRLSNSRVLLSPSYVLMSRYARNVIKILTATHRFNPHGAGPHLVRFVREAFDTAGFRTSPESPLAVPGPSGNTLTDIDVAAFKDGYLFIVEVRTHSLPDSRAEKYWAKLRILDAAENADQGAQFTRSRIAYVLNWMGPEGSVSENDVKHVVPMVVTNIRQFSGLDYGGVWVTDDAALGKILEDPVLTQSSLDEKSQSLKPVRSFKLTTGPRVSGPELERFLQHPFWLDFIGERGALETLSTQIGPVTLSVPSRELAFPLSDSLASDA